ncbi:MAG: FlgD immunoglobulin-like domain containing protein [Candidatus Cloacimonadota bacterium]|nr:FlgD immunoglobulin-like domain containing protein [Candidatus Cloacimonadota bacterium]
MKNLIFMLILIFYSTFLFSQSEEIWDLHFQVDVTTPSGFASPSGVETDGEYFYVSNSFDNQIAKFDLNGTWIENFTIPNIPFGLNDLTTDGDYFYGGSGSANTIFQIDFNSQSIIGGITSPITVDAIAYDPNEDAFWVTNWQADVLMLIDRNGVLLNQLVFTDGAKGLAHDSYSAGEPFLWTYTGVYTGGNGIVTQYQLPDFSPTGLSHNVTEDFPGTHAGGLFCSCEIVPDFIILGGIAKGTTSYLFGYEITATGYAPGPPTNYTLTADPTGALEVLVSWINPAVDENGNPLTELNEIRLYRNAALIYSNTTPVIGESATYNDVSIPSSGYSEYLLTAINSYGNSSVSGIVWVGPDVPDSVSNFYGEQVAPNYSEIILTWDNPIQGLHGGPLIDPILGYSLEDNLGTVYELLGSMEQFFLNVINPGTYYFMIAPYNSVGIGGITTSNNIVVELTSSDSHLISEAKYQLSNYPDPFNPVTTIQFSIPQESKVKLTIYNIKGQKVKSLVNATCETGINTAIWNGTNDSGKRVSTGVYFYKLNVNGKAVKSKKMLLK